MSKRSKRRAEALKNSTARVGPEFWGQFPMPTYTRKTIKILPYGPAKPALPARPFDRPKS